MSGGTEQNDDNFAAAFELAAREDAAPAKTAEPTAPAATEAAKPDEAAAPADSQPAADNTSVPPPSASAAEGEGDAKEIPLAEASPPPPQEEVKAEPPKADNDDLLNRLAELVRQPPKAEPKTETPAPAAQEEPLYTKDEQEFLASYEKEWPDVTKAEALKRRAEYREVVGYVFQQVAPIIKELKDTVQTLAAKTQYNELATNITDYDDVREKVVAWVEKQPKYLQVAYNHVIQEGTVDEIKDLIDRYKADSGATLAAKPAAPAAPAAKKETVLPPAAKQAAAALAPVSSKRSAVVSGVDPADFDGAFQQFAANL